MGGGIDKEFKVNNLTKLPVPTMEASEIPLSNEEILFIKTELSEKV